MKTKTMIFKLIGILSLPERLINSFLLSVLTFIFIFNSTALYADIYYVDANAGDDGNSGNNWANATKSIQAAVNIALEGDIVLVTNGVYNTGSMKNARRSHFN
jgi:hypothetical protein